MKRNVMNCCIERKKEIGVMMMKMGEPWRGLYSNMFEKQRNGCGRFEERQRKVHFGLVIASCAMVGSEM